MTDHAALRAENDLLKKQLEDATRRVAELTAQLSTVSLRPSSPLEPLTLEQLKILQALLEVSPDRFFVLDKTGHILYSDKRGLETLPQEANLVNNNWQTFEFPAENSEGFKSQFNTVLATGQPVTREYHRLTERGLQYFECTLAPFLGPEGALSAILSTVRNITERKLAELALIQSRNFYLSLFDEAPVMIWRAGLDGKADFFNKTWLAFTGRTLELEIAHGWAEGIHPYEVEVMAEAFNKAFENRQPYEYEYRRRRYDGEYRWLMSRGRPFNDLEGNFAGYIGSCYDITDLKKAEKALEAEKERLAVTLRSIGDAVIAADISGNIILLNQEAERLTGWSQSEATAKPVAEVFQILERTTHSPLENPLNQVLQVGQMVELPHTSILQPRHRQELLVAVQASPLREKDGQLIGAVLVFRDVTQKEKINAELFRSGKLESLGIMAGGIAHDFNNILTVIMGNLSLTKLYANPGGKIHTMLEEAERASAQAKDLTQQLLTFARGGAPVKKPILINGILKDAATFALHGTSLQLIFEIPSNLWPVDADDGQLSRAIQNLVINAVQASPSKERIIIKAENFRVLHDISPQLDAGNYIHVSIQDFGTGISPDFLPRIFDPYFTTKKQGSGLGLAVVYSVVKGHNGHVRVESELGAGTTVHLYLPALEQLLVEPPPVVEAPVTHSGKPRILVMDDEALIRRLAVRVLHHLGYEAETAQDGAEAIELYVAAKASGKPFDAVVMDLTVPGGMGGEEALRRLLALDEEVKAIVSSGYSHDPVMANYQYYGFKAVVTKPYGVEQLGSVLLQVLGLPG
jgi:PAS domain S-box-containing protein